MRETSITIVKHVLAAVITTLCMAACTPTPSDSQLVDELPPIYPDYTDVTIPCNIAPLNFLLRGDYEAVEMKAVCGEVTLQINAKGQEICIPTRRWKDFLHRVDNRKVEVTVSVLEKGQWKQFRPFFWQVTTDEVDPYLTYRLIEPDYEIYQNLSLRERCVENFDERAICDYRLVGNRCMNCHVYGNGSADLSMLYVRGEGGGAILNRQGKLSKLNIKTDDMVSGSVYFGFSPSGRYIVFSTNKIIPAFHAKPSKRLEVFDSASDIYVADLEKHTILRCPLLCDSTVFETFPTFSPDGKHIYYCASPKVSLPMELKEMRYSLCRIAFNEATATFGNQVDTLFSGQQHQASVCHPRISPDGKYIVFSIADYGTFPIWHQETDLLLMNLTTGDNDNMDIANSDKSDTYHSWSSSSRWLVFASKRDDGLYGKPYFCYIDQAGKVHKPFVLPQKNPHFYDYNLKSFNVLEMGKDRLPFDAMDIKHAVEGPSIDFHY